MKKLVTPRFPKYVETESRRKPATYICEENTSRREPATYICEENTSCIHA